MKAQRLKIAHIVTRLDRGGSADMVVALCERLNRDRFEVTLITGPSTDPVEEPERLADRLGVTVAMCPDLIRAVRPGRDLRALLALRSYLARLRPDVVHTHTSKAGALGRLAAAWAGGIPVVHSPHGHLFYGYYGTLGTGLVVLAERLLAPLAERIAVLTDVSRTEHLSRDVGRFDQYVTVPSGIDRDRFRVDRAARERVRSQFGLVAPPPARGRRLARMEPVLVGWVGRFAAVKGPDLFLEACGHIARLGDLPFASFLMAGDGAGRAEVEARAAELGVADRCRFLGQRADVPDLLNACDVFVLSSRNEGLGLAAAEAMACGTPVVAADVGGVAELLEHGRAGVLVPPGQPAALAAAVIALAEDEERRTRLTVAGLRRAKRYGIDAMVGACADLYEELA